MAVPDIVERLKDQGRADGSAVTISTSAAPARSRSSPIAPITDVHETSIRRDNQGAGTGSASSPPNRTPA